MVSVGIIAVVILLVAFRLLVSPFPAFSRLSKRFGTRTTVVLCSIAIAGAVVAIAVSRH
jgi:hypothetical protein